MLTPNQIKNHLFQNSKDVYQIQEVDAYMNEIVASYEQMFKENKELLGKLEELARAVEDYHADEDQIKDALIVAQKMANQIKLDANEKANAVTKEAQESADALTTNASEEANALLMDAKVRSEATLNSSEVTANDVIEGAKVLANNVINQAKFSSEEIIANAKIEVELYQTIINETKAEAAVFKAELLEHYQSHIRLIDELPNQIANALEESVALKKKEHAESINAVESEPTPSETEEAQVDLPEEIESVEQMEQSAQASYTAPPIEAPVGVDVEEIAPVNKGILEFEDVYSGDESDAEEEVTAPEEIMLTPLDAPKHKMKFGEDYDINDDDEEEEYEDGEDSDRGFKGFFRRKK